MKRLASELPQGMARSVSSSRPASARESVRPKRGQDRNVYRTGAERHSVSPHSKPTSVARFNPYLCSGHTMN